MIRNPVTRLAYGTLKMTTDVPAKRAFLKQLRDKYRNQAGLSKAWGIELPAWELMEDPGFVPPLPNPEHPEIEADFKYFQKVFADTYFKTISDALKWHAPNQLLLGGRFAISTPEAVASCAQYCDVLSFNMYTLKPQDGYDFAALGSLGQTGADHRIQLWLVRSWPVLGRRDASGQRRRSRPGLRQLPQTGT
jgi:hypothetical protein